MFKTNNSRRLLIIFGILAGLLLITTIVLGVLYGVERNKGGDDDDDELCLTSSCIKAANFLLESIDETIDPCEDFYQFACGKWIKKTRIPDDANVQSTSGVLRDQLTNTVGNLLLSSPLNGTVELKSITYARRMYQSCINEDAIDAEGVDVILRLVDTEFGGWPILKGSTWNNSTFNFPYLLLKLSEYKYNVFYNIRTEIDEKNSTFRSIRISQNELGLIDRNTYLNESDLTRAYRQFMRDLALAMTNDTSMIEDDINDIYAFEQSIAKYIWTSADQSMYSNKNIRTTINNLPSAMNASFNFLNYIRDLYLLGNITLTDTDIVSVSELEYIRNVSLIISQQSPRTLQNYMIWRFMMNQASNMPKQFQVIKQQFDQIFRGTITQKSRLLTCSDDVNNMMGPVIAKLYKDVYFDTSARNQSLEMIANIRNAFIDIVSQTTWMDSDSKMKAIEKAKAINEKIGYPDYIDGDDMTKLENEYAEHVFNLSYMQNLLLIYKVERKQNLRSLRQSIDRTVWQYPPVIINAFYNPSLNDICFPAGILQLPFFDKDVPKYLNYGGIGMVMGHEITHGFDEDGRQYDKDGNKVSWWTNETIGEFNKNKDCIIQQYNNFIVTQVNLQLNGQQTLGENIADNGGLKEAFFAYQKWSQTHVNVDKKLPGLSKYSAEQLFFLNFGQQWCQKGTDQHFKNQISFGVHSPSQFRVIGPTSNFDQFARVFNCKAGQQNNPTSKCTVW